MSGAMLYLEGLAEELVRLPHRDDAPLTQLIIDMADKLKVADDTTLAYITDPSSDPDWLARLRAHADQTKVSIITLYQSNWQIPALLDRVLAYFLFNRCAVANYAR